MSDRIERQNAIELHLVEGLLGSCAATAANPLVLEKQKEPEPDVLVVCVDGRRIGVEVTEVTPGGEEARRSGSEQQKALGDALRRYEAAAHPPVGVTVFRNAWTPMDRKQRDGWAQRFAAWVAERVPTEGECVVVDACDWPRPELPAGVDTVRIIRRSAFGTHWDAPRAAFPPQISVESVQARISDKNTRVPNYRGEYDELWLLIAAGMDGPATWGLVGEPLQEHTFVTAYDRVFVVSRHHDCAELRTTRILTAG